jgi:hypothetical protein
MRLPWRRRPKLTAPPPGTTLADIDEMMRRPHDHRCSACDAAWAHVRVDCIFEEHDRALRGERFFGLCPRCRRYRRWYFPLFLEITGASPEEQRIDTLRGWALAARKEHREQIAIAVVWSAGASVLATAAALHQQVREGLLAILVVGGLIYVGLMLVGLAAFVMKRAVVSRLRPWRELQAPRGRGSKPSREDM